MHTTRLYLAEETHFQPAADEDMYVSEERQSDIPDWSSDPMEILMHKQELERLMLLAEMSLTH